MDAIALFTRDLRVHDHPALTAASRAARRALPLFVLDEALTGAPNRTGFLLESLRDLDASLRAAASRLHSRGGDVVQETLRAARAVGAEPVFLSKDGSRYAQAREARLAASIETEMLPGVTAVPVGGALTIERGRHRGFSPHFPRGGGGPPRPPPAPPPREEPAPPPRPPRPAP